MTVNEKLTALNIKLPVLPQQTVANYIPVKKTGNLLFIAGQVCRRDGQMVFTGQAPSLDDAKKAVHLCGLNMLAQIDRFCGLQAVKSCVKIGVFINSATDFTQHSVAADGVSDLIVGLFGDAGRHTRVAVGCSSLPSNSMAEVEGVFEV